MQQLCYLKIIWVAIYSFTYNILMLCLSVVAHIELQHDHHYIAMAALSQLDELCKNICDKSITLRSLDIVKEKSNQLKDLCNAVKGHCKPYSQVGPQLKKCIELQLKFMDYRNQISTLLGLCSSISDGMLYHYATK